MTHQLSCSTACGIFLDQVLNPSHLHWPVNSLPLSYQGILSHFFLVEIYHVYRFNRDPDDGDLQMMVLYIYTHTHTHTHIHESEGAVDQLCPTLWPMDCSPPGLLCPMNSQGKNTGMGCHSLLQGIFLAQGSNLNLPHCRQILYHLSHKWSLCTHTHTHNISRKMCIICINILNISFVHRKLAL